MKGFAQEHLEVVAERYRDEYEMDENYFVAHMFCIGWSLEEVEEMIKFLKRKRG